CDEQRRAMAASAALMHRMPCRPENCLIITLKLLRLISAKHGPAQLRALSAQRQALERDQKCRVRNSERGMSNRTIDSSFPNQFNPATACALRGGSIKSRDRATRQSARGSDCR